METKTIDENLKSIISVLEKNGFVVGLKKSSAEIFTLELTKDGMSDIHDFQSVCEAEQYLVLFDVIKSVRNLRKERKGKNV